MADNLEKTTAENTAEEVIEAAETAGEATEVTETAEEITEATEAAETAAEEAVEETTGVTAPETEQDSSDNSALDSFLSREQEEKKPVKASKINKKILIPIIAAVAVAVLVIVLIALRSNPGGMSEEEQAALAPADIKMQVTDKGEHEAEVTLDEKGEILHNGTGSLLSYVPADIKRIDVENLNGSFSVLSNTPNGEATVYTLVGFEGVELQAGIADEVATATSTLEFTQIVSANGDPADFGLDHPRAVATVSYNDNTTAVIKVGNDAAAQAGTYISFGSGSAVYLVDSNKMSPLLYSVNQFINLAITDTNENSDNSIFSTLTITGSRYPEAITLIPNDDDAIEASYIVTEPRRMFAKETEGYDIAGAIRGLYGEEVVCVHPSSGQLSSYGVSDPYASVTAEYPDTTITLSCSAPTDTGLVYIYNPDKDIIYTIQLAAVSWARTSVEALTPEYIINAHAAAVDTIEFVAGDKDYTIDVTTKTESVENNEGNTEEVTTTSAVYENTALTVDNFSIFFQNLNGIKNMGMVDGSGSEVMRFTFTYTTGRNPDVVKAYDIGGAQYAVELNGEIVGSASKSYIDSLIVGADALVKGENLTSL